MTDEQLPSREDAWALLCEHTRGENLRKHGLAVEAVMRAYARKLGEDEDLWGTVGLLHDFDYEAHPTPEEHPFVGNEILGQRGYPNAVRHAIMCHADYTGYERLAPVDKAIFACDELAGFLIACALVQPGKVMAQVTPRSVRKKLKDKAFARSVVRDDIYRGAADFGVDLDEHATFCIAALAERAGELGLGTPEAPL